MATMQTWRKAYSALKDQTKVGLAHVNSDFKDVDVAIVKATDHVEWPPKERHIRKVLAANTALRPRADVQYYLHALARRLGNTRNWTELSQIRFRLCPGYLKERQFWRIYFTLVKNYVAKYELHAIRMEKLKQIAIENKKESNTNGYEVEMLESRKPTDLEPETSLK